MIRTLKLGHPLTQGTVDSNELWLDVTVTSGDRVIGRSGGLDPNNGNEVDRWAHFVNVFMLDREGNRINRRNPQDIFVPLYNHQIPPGAGWTVHYGLRVARRFARAGHGRGEAAVPQVRHGVHASSSPRTASRAESRSAVTKPGKPYVNELPITTLAVDRVTFPVDGVDEQPTNSPSDIPAWQRWNDYGIGLLIKGKAELRQAAEAFDRSREAGPLTMVR